MQALHSFQFTRNGRSFTAEIHVDDSQDAPWDREDGHGPVRIAQGSSCYSNRPTKRPGERFLTRDRRWGILYDWQAACKLARAEGWTAEPYDAPGRIERAVRADFERMRSFAVGDWCYVGVTVKPDDDEDAEPQSLWGIESDCDDYLQECARELADGCAPTYVHEFA
jgi:hypothetical protein